MGRLKRGLVRLKTITPFCHCEERSDAAIQPNHPTPLATPSLVIARRGKAPTWQSSDRVGQLWRPSPRRRFVPDWIATSVLFETFLAMTESVWIATPCRARNDRAGGIRPKTVTRPTSPIPVPTVVIARSEATRQSSRTIPPRSPRQSHVTTKSRTSFPLKST